MWIALLFATLGAAATVSGADVAPAGDPDASIARAVDPDAVAAEAVTPTAWLRIGGGPLAGTESGPASDDVRDLVVGPHGALWVATPRGVSRFHHGAFTHFTTRQGLPSDPVTALAAVPEGVVVATDRGLVRLADEPPAWNRPERLDAANGGRASYTALVLQDERLWALRLDRGSGEAVVGEVRPSAVEPSRWTFERLASSRGVRRLLPGGPGRLLLQDRTRTWNESVFDSQAVPSQWADEGAPVAARELGNATFVLRRRALCRVRRDAAVDCLPLTVDGGPGGGAGGVLGAGADAVWLARAGSLHEVDAEGLVVRRALSLPPGAVPTALAADWLGRVWLGTPDGLFVADPHRAELPRRESPADCREARAGKEADPTVPADLTLRGDAGITSRGALWARECDGLLVSSEDDVRSVRRLDAGTPDCPVVDVSLVTSDRVALACGVAWRGPTGWRTLSFAPSTPSTPAALGPVSELGVVDAARGEVGEVGLSSPDHDERTSVLRRLEQRDLLLEYISVSGGAARELESILPLAESRDLETRDELLTTVEGRLGAGWLLDLLRRPDERQLALLDRVDELLRLLVSFPGVRDQLEADFGLEHLQELERDDGLVAALRERYGVRWFEWLTRSEEVHVLAADAGVTLVRPADWRARGLLLVRQGDGVATRPDAVPIVGAQARSRQAVWEAATGDVLVLPDGEPWLGVVRGRGDTDGFLLERTALPAPNHAALRLLAAGGPSSWATLWDGGSVWQHSATGDWTPLVGGAAAGKRARRPPSLAGLLPAPDGAGLLVACNDCPTRVYHVDGDGRQTPVGFAGDAGPERVFACGEALFRDHAGREFVTGRRAIAENVDAPVLWMRGGPEESFRPLRDRRGRDPGVHALDFAESADGTVWVAVQAAGSGVWRVAGSPGREYLVRVLSTEGPAGALALSVAAGREVLWVGGRPFLAQANPKSGRGTAHPAWRSGEGIALGRTIVRLLPDGGGMLVQTMEGPVWRLGPGGEKDVTPEGWPSGRLVDPFGTLLARLPDGRVLLYAEPDGAPERGRTFVRDVGVDEPFRPVASAPRGLRSVAIAEDGRVLVASRDFVLWEWDGQHFVPLRDLAPEGSPAVRRLMSVCPLPGGRLLSLDSSGILRYQRPSEVAKSGFEAAEPWRWCASLGSRWALLARSDRDTFVDLRAEEDGGTRLATREARYTGDRPARYRAFAAAPVAGEEFRPRVVVVADDKVWELCSDPDGALRPEILAGLPEGAALDDEPALAASADAVWLGSRGEGLWRLRLSDSGCPAGHRVESRPQAVWENWGEMAGLPSGVVDAVVPVDSRRTLLFTAAGPVTATSVGDNLTFRRVVPRGVAGSKPGAATIFEMADARFVAVGSDTGISILREPLAEAGKGPGDWSHLDATAGLRTGAVSVLRWLPRRTDSSAVAETGELWVGGSDGLAIVDVRAGKSKPTLPRGLGIEDGLPAGAIVDLTLSPDGSSAWALVRVGGGHRLVRLARSTVDPLLFEATEAEPALLAAVEEARLAPSPDGRAPRVLVRDVAGRWSLWSPAAYLRPRLEVHRSILGVSARLAVGRLDALAAQGADWVVQFALDGRWERDGDASDIAPGAAWFPFELLWSRRSHEVRAEVRRLGPGPPQRFMVTRPLDGESFDAWFLRLGLVIVVLALAATLGVLRLLRFRRTRERVRAKWIPYIQGQAIRNPDQFFGREELLATVRDNIAVASYALIGALRIGKTSLQHRLTALLREMEHPDHVFLPIFLDLQHIGANGGPFLLHFLGEKLVDLAERLGVPDESLGRLRIAGIETPEAYRPTQLASDVKRILAAIGPAYKPRTPVIVLQIDECGLMAGYPGDVLAGFRAQFVNQPLLKTILSGPMVARHEELDMISPWWNFLTELEVLPMTVAEGRELIERPVQGVFRFDDDAIVEILAYTERRPLEIQRLCASLLRYKYARGGSRRVSAPDVRAVMKDRARWEGDDAATEEENA